MFAHEDEAQAFARAGVPHLVTGIGKVNAAFALTRALVGDPLPADRVVVLGTAGGITDSAKLETVYRITSTVQHDFSLGSERIDLATPATGGARVSDTAIIATGDTFVQSDEQRIQLSALGATLVDMEIYAYAAVCKALEVPLEVYKTPSDFADSSTTMQTWEEIVNAKSEQLFEFAGQYLPEVLG